MDQARARRRELKTQTRRDRSTRACDAHLRDLQSAHGSAPPDIALPRSSVPTRLSGEPTSSYCTSPAALCVELAE
jgi:hypothetical protein